MSDWKDGERAGQWFCRHGVMHANARHKLCDGCCNADDYPGKAEFTARVMAQFSELATCPPVTEKGLYAESARHHNYRFERGKAENRRIDKNTGNRLYNFEFCDMRDYKGLPTYESVLVIGAGPSATHEAIVEQVPKHDCVLVTQPMVKGMRGILEREGVYVTDAEYDAFIVPWYYGHLTTQMRLVTIAEKHIEETTPFRELWGVPDAVRPPRSSGAMSLWLALEVFNAKRITFLGIDLSYDYQMFEGETRPLINAVRARNRGTA